MKPSSKAKTTHIISRILLRSILSLLASAVLSQKISHAQSIETGTFEHLVQYGKINEGLTELDRATAKKWERLEEWQRKESWINEQVRLGAVGVVYEHAMFGGVVSRNVVPDKNMGWLVVDRIQLNGGPLLQIGNLAGNLFFQAAFPYVQVGATLNKSYVNVRSRTTYKDALLANPFEFKKIPADSTGFSQLEKGEIVSTMTSGGLYVHVGASIFDLMGIVVTGGVGVGPRAKVHVNKEFKLTLSKNSESEILAMFEDSLETGLGLGITTGVSIDNLLDIPVAIGINQADGYSPIRLNYKYKTEKLKSVIYRINIKSSAGAKAYQALMNRDLTVLDEMVRQKNSSVVRELIRNGTRDTTELNAGLDLIFYRAGFREISTEGLFKSTYGDGKTFRYKELTAERIDEVSAYDGAWQSSEKYAALVPLSKESRTLDSFVLDTTIHYVSSEASGEDLQEMLTHYHQLVNHLPMKIVPNPEKNYGQVQMYLVVRFPGTAIQKILKSSDRERWLALGVSAGLMDPGQWTSLTSRQRWESERGSEEAEKLSAANAAARFIKSLQTMKSRETQAQALLGFLKADDTKILHRALVEIAGRDQLVIRGRIQGTPPKTVAK